MWKFLFIVFLSRVRGGPLQDAPSSANWFNPFQIAVRTYQCPPCSAASGQIGSSLGANQPVPFGISNVGTNFYQNFVVSGIVPLSANSLAPVSRPIIQPRFLATADYTYTPGVGAHKYHMRAVTWNEARQSCYDEGGHLAIINSVAEAQMLGKILNDSGPVTGVTWSDNAFLGFHDLYKQGEWVTILGKPLADTGYQVWASSQPNNVNGVQHCGALDSKGAFYDISCTDKLTYFCEQTID